MDKLNSYRDCRAMAGPAEVSFVKVPVKRRYVVELYGYGGG